MGFMKPVAEYLSAQDVIDFEIFDEEICSEGPEAGWYSRLSAPGYLDATDWHGPYKTSDEALREVMHIYEVDENGDSNAGT